MAVIEMKSEVTPIINLTGNTRGKDRQEGY